MIQDIGKTIKQIREERNLSQRELSKMSGVTYSALTKIETGIIRSPRIEVIAKLAQALEITIDELVNPILKM